jgi:hypothetical protein
LLNLLNRLRLEQRIRHRITAAINQLHRQILEENHPLYEQHLREAKLLWNRYANASRQTQRSEYLSQQAFDHKSTYLNIIQLKAQLTSLEQSLASVVEYLNSSSLAD